MKYFILLTVFLFCIPLYAAEKITESDVVSAVLESNPEVRAALFDYEGERAASASSWFLPNPKAGVEYMGIPDGSLWPDEYNEKSFFVAQKIPFPGKYPFRIGAAAYGADVKKYSYEFIRRQRVLEAHTAFAAYYCIKKQIEITEESAEALRQITQIAAARYGRSGASAPDAVKAELEYALTENRLEAMKQELSVKAALIARLTGGSVVIDERTEISDPEIPEMMYGPDRLAESAFNNSPEISMARAEMNQTENTRNEAGMEFFPDLNVVFSKQRTPLSDGYSLMFEVEIPLWFFANQKPAFEKASAGYESAKKKHEDKKNRIIYKIKEFYEAVKLYERTLKLYDEILIPRAKAVFESTVSLYRGGNGDFLDVIDAQRKELELRMDYYAYTEEYIKKYYTLMARSAENFPQ